MRDQTRLEKRLERVADIVMHVSIIVVMPLLVLLLVVVLWSMMTGGLNA